jgi:hypothetical protein
MAGSTVTLECGCSYRESEVTGAGELVAMCARIRDSLAQLLSETAKEAPDADIHELLAIAFARQRLHVPTRRHRWN